MILSRKDAQMVADNHYSRKNKKNGILATILGSGNPMTVDFLNNKFSINSAAARVAEIQNETGISFERFTFQDSSKGVSVAYAA